ncbi:MAG: phosphate ABC transporter permease PstA [Gammaproteobacteria bacterium]
MSSTMDAITPRRNTRKLVAAGLKRRHAKERRFKFVGMLSVLMSMIFLAVMLITIASNGYSAFWQTFVKIDVNYDTEVIDPTGERDAQTLSRANYKKLVKNALKEAFPDVEGRRNVRRLNRLISSDASYELRRRVMANPDIIGTRESVWVAADDDIDMLVKGHIDRELPESQRRVNDQQVSWVDKLWQEDRVEKRFNTSFFTTGDSREPEQAGIRVALLGSFFMLMVTLALSFPIGVATAVYLEEFAPRNRWTDLVEVNVNNLAAVPSIVFGLLGLAVFINFFGLPRSVPLVGGLVLTLMTLPTIIIASRAALKAVPPSIREAAFGMGASKLQMVTHHVLPLALPGMLTGTIIGMARALGETAPLLMIGMVAFIVDIPNGPTDPATALPVQIYLWADSPERAFVEKTSAATLVLLGFMLAMNGLAVVLRKKFERSW